jgi:hypothetical protein
MRSLGKAALQTAEDVELGTETAIPSRAWIWRVRGICFVSKQKFSKAYCSALALLLLFSAGAFAKDFQAPKAAHADTYAIHDEHATEKVTMAAEPYDTPAKASVFRVNYLENDYLPVFVVISNDSDQLIDMAGFEAEMVTGKRTKIQSATNDDLYRRLSRVRHRGDEPSRNPLPVPLPGGGPKVGVNKDTRKEVEAAQFRGEVIPPHTTRAGFLFFDIEGIRNPLAGAHLYVTGIRGVSGQELMFFDLPIGTDSTGIAK